MSYKSLIDKNVAKAFVLLKDLVLNATLNKKPNPAFDFSTGGFPTQADSTYPAKVLIIKAAKLSTETNLLLCTVLVKVSTAIDIANCDTVTIGSVIWQLGPVISSNGFIFEMQLQRTP